LEPGDIVGPIPAWRDKPIFVVKRTDAMLAALNDKKSRLADPDSLEEQQPTYARNDSRSLRPDVLVLVGICTHLGCSPKFKPEVIPQDFDSEWMGGFYCPCHGSKFDMAGRVYSGVPAPSNMEVPPYYYEGDSVLVIGVDKGAV
jgi:ubiquinol-cytochrome c reductase iron-sulfur subunit